MSITHPVTQQQPGHEIHIGMIGFRGIPSSYGGNEEFCRHIAPRLVERGLKVTVYCRSGLFKDRSPTYEGVRRVFLPTIESKAAGQFIHAGLAVLAAARDRVHIVYVQSLPSGPQTLVPAALRTPIVVNTDGLEWQRAKWGRFGRGYLELSRDIILRTARVLVSDSRAIQRYYREQHGRDSVFAPYGWEPTTPDLGLLESMDLTPKSYYLIVSRLVPENQVDVMVRAYSRLPTKRALVVVGSAAWDDRWQRDLRALASPRVRFVGHIHDPALLDALHCGAYGYLHGHSVGGTNPGLVRALGSGACAIAFRSPYNAEVLTLEDGSECGLLWRDEVELAHCIESIDTDSERADSLAKAARARAESDYSWDSITETYEAVFRKVAAGWRLQ